MFEVWDESNEVYTVYEAKAVNSVGGGYNTLFLIFKDGKWVWVSSNGFIPKP